MVKCAIKKCTIEILKSHLEENALRSYLNIHDSASGKQLWGFSYGLTIPKCQ